MNKKSSFSLDGDGIVVRCLRGENSDEVLALWRWTEGVGLNEPDTRHAIAAYLPLNPQFSFFADPRIGRFPEIDEDAPPAAPLFRKT